MKSESGGFQYETENKLRRWKKPIITCGKIVTDLRWSPAFA